jgi:hypothetical protein
MRVAVLFGVQAQNLNDACGLLENELGIKMAGHHSLHWGGDYYRYDTPTALLILQSNLDIEDDEPAEPEYSNYAVILRADLSDHSPVLRKLLSVPAFTKLRMNEYQEQR